MSATGAHWDAAYERLGDGGAGWHEDVPGTSIEMVAAADLAPGDPVIDVGGGAAALVDHLLAGGSRDLAVLDVSRTALATTRARLGASADEVEWIHADVLGWRPGRSYALWHDRAVFHFLIEEADRHRYLEVLREALRPGGHAVIATFAPDAPDRCSGLPVARYGARELTREFGPGFVAVASRRTVHRTPRGTAQPFTWLLLRDLRTGSDSG